MNLQEVRQGLDDHAGEIALVDTHEHMERTPRGDYPKSDLFDMVQNTFYLWSDLVSSGMPPVPWRPDEKDDDKKWQILKKYLPNVVNTGYYRGILAGLRSIYQLEGNSIDDSNWRNLNEVIKKAYEDPVWPEKVMRDKTNIQVAINDVDGFNMNRSLFLPSLKFDYLLRGSSKVGRENIRLVDGLVIDTFN